jgi:hypothetical protein
LHEVQAFVEEKKHLEFRHAGEHSNIGGGWEIERDRVKEVRCISNATLRLMLLASPLRMVVPLLDTLSLFPAPSSSEAMTSNVKCNLHFREGLTAIEKIQIIAMNMIELLSVERKSRNTMLTLGEKEIVARPACQEEVVALTQAEKQAVKENVRKNLDSFNVTGELLKFLKAIIDAHS